MQILYCFLKTKTVAFFILPKKILFFRSRLVSAASKWTLMMITIHRSLQIVTLYTISVIFFLGSYFFMAKFFCVTLGYLT